MPSTSFARYTPKLYKGLEQYFNNEKDILDITAGYRSMWKTYYKYLPSITRVLFLDKRPEVKPDLTANNEHLPFPDKRFNTIVYDPPHWIEQSTSYYKTGFGQRFWGWSSLKNFLNNLVQVNKEAHRVLKSDGTLILKWTELLSNTGFPLLTTLKYLNNFKEKNRVKLPSKSGHSKNKVYLIWLKKIGVNP